MDRLCLAASVRVFAWSGLDRNAGPIPLEASKNGDDIATKPNRALRLRNRAETQAPAAHLCCGGRPSSLASAYGKLQHGDLRRQNSDL
ncbi:hypothetical protein G7Z17_g2873 [Cylindrodendrum hubeiense]|uniref:Uncharacterized protein n=1 Tax=Cylindrodendrum hubeiense TaxID=595255 RepID=A0A9P5HK29_9HYPO|nr:hypothetical protein G7Z17_g2873 [Cylindrodendrum hubeiense]